MTMINFYSSLVSSLHASLLSIEDRGPVATASGAVEYAEEVAAKIGHVSPRTVRRWRADFEANGHRFSESLVGKAVHVWILDNETMVRQAKRWLKHNVGRKPKEGEAYFQI